MAILHGRNIPDELYNKLHHQAQQQKRSMSAEVIMMLQERFANPQRTPAEILASISQRRYFAPTMVQALNSTDLLRADRER